MPFFKFSNIKISCIASAVPSTVVKVDDYIEKYGESHIEKFKAQTGITQFHKTKEHQTASDLCYAAAENVLKHKSIAREEIGALVFVAHSTDYRRPATACVLHKRLGLSKDCAAMDINLGCSAFVYGLQNICSMMECSDIKYGLLLVGETLTQICHPDDRTVSMLFGDGGAAILLEKEANVGEICGLLKTDGNGYKAIIAPAGGFRNMNAPHDLFTSKDGGQRTLYNTWMAGEDVFAFTISDVPKTIKEFLVMTNTTIGDYDCYAMHQANQFIHGMLAKKLKMDRTRMPLCLDRYGNTSAAAIPMVLSDRYGAEDSADKQRVLMCGFGVGLSWGVVSAELRPCDILPIIISDEIFEEGIINSPEDFL